MKSIGCFNAQIKHRIIMFLNFKITTKYCEGQYPIVAFTSFAFVLLGTFKEADKI